MKVETVRVMSVVEGIISTPASTQLHTRGRITNKMYSLLQHIKPPRFVIVFGLPADDDNQAHSLCVSENTHCAPLFGLNAALTRN